MSESTTSDEVAIDGVPITLNGKEILADKGELLIAAAERHGVYIPRFCYHPRMNPVGMCRMCLVEVDTGRGASLQPSCMLECTPGMVVETESEPTRKAQEGVLEYLLANHPLDCPVCDKGGECPLQDQTMSHGPGESRFVEEKRHYEKPIAISDLILLDRERCILCDRCTRFAKEVAGEPQIHFINRSDHTEVNTFPDEPFTSYFSGNTVQICPVGALTAKTYRFRARPWDLAQTESTCPHCAVGCRVLVQSSRDQVLRCLGVDSDPVNWGWICDKGRFGFQAIGADNRLRDPLVRIGDTLQPVHWNEAMRRAAHAIREGLDASGPSGLAVLGGSHLTNEDAYAWTKLAKGVLGTDNVDAQVGDGLPAEVVAGLPRATIDEACRPGGTVVLLGPDLKEELPVLFLRLRDAVTKDRVTLIDVAPVATSMSALSRCALQYRAGEAAEVAKVLVGSAPHDKEVAGVPGPALAEARALIEGAEGPVTVVLGRQSLAESPGSLVDAAGVLSAGLPGVRFLSALRRGNVHGAIDLGMGPGLLPGRVGIDSGRAWFGSHWPTMPAEVGLDAVGMLTAAAEGRIDTLVLLGADPLADFPDRELAAKALTRVKTIIACDTFLNESAGRAHIVFPAAAFAEVDGTTTNIEGRVTVLYQRVTPPGSARTDWMIAAELATHLGTDLGLESSAQIWNEIEAVSSAHAGITGELLHGTAGTDGLVAGRQGAGSVDQSRPEALVHVPTPPADPPAVDSYSLRLVSSRKLYDRGTTVSCSPALSGLVPGTVLRVNAYDFDRLGVVEGSQVQISTARATVTLPIHVDAGVPRGSAAIHFNQPPVQVSSLIDANERVTDVRVESGVDTTQEAGP